MIDKMSEEERAKLLAEQIAGLIAILELKEQGGRILVTVDHSQIYDYASPSYEDIYFNENNLAEQVALTFLFEQFIINHHLYLLPPYEIELESSIESQYIKHLSLSQTMRKKDIEKKVLSDFMYNSEVLRISDELKEDPKRELSNQEMTTLFNYLKINYLEAYVTLTLGTRDSLTVFQSIQADSRIKYLSDPDSELPCIINHAALKKRAERERWKKINQARPQDRKRYANYLDAIALEYLQELNVRINPQGMVLILVTDTGFRQYCAEWPKIPDALVFLPHHEEGKPFHIPCTVHPITIFAYLVCREKTIPETIKKLKELLDFSQVIRCSYENLKIHIDTGLSNQARDRLKEITDGLGSVNNLKEALRTRDEGTHNIVENIITKITQKKDTVFNKFANRFGILIEAIRKSESLQGGIDKFIADIKETILQNIMEVKDLASLARAAMMITTNPARYMFSEDDYDDAEIKRLFLQIKTRTDIEESLERLFVLKRGRYTRSDIEKLRGWEAAVLITQLKMRTGNDPWALKDCEEGMRNAPGDIKALFGFLLNILLSHKSSTFSEALQGAAELARKYTHKSPRYHLQHGYLIWVGSEKNAPGCNLDEARRVTETALKFAQKGYRNKTCHRLALSNLANFAVAQQDMEKAEDYLRKLDESLDREEQISMFRYTRANVWLARLRHSQSLPKDVIDIKLNKIKYEFSLINKGEVERSEFALLMYERLKKEIDKFESSIKQ